MPVVLERSARTPLAVLAMPVVLEWSAWYTAGGVVVAGGVGIERLVPLAVLPPPSVLEQSA